MKKTTSLGCLLVVLAVSSDSSAQSKAADIFRSAVRDYINESQDYIETLHVTSREVRTWRSALLAERFEGKLVTIETELTQSNNQILTEVERSIKENGVDGLDDVLLMRMAQLQFEKEGLVLSKRMKAYDAQMKSYFEGRLTTPPQIPSPNYKLAIDYAMMLIRRYPRSPLSDRAHYLMAYAQEEMGLFDEARKTYISFLSRHPYSPLSDEARWRLGEFYFDTQDYQKAKLFYGQLILNKTSKFRLKAIYKQASTHFAEKKYQQAANLFLKLHEEAQLVSELSRENETLIDESLEYLGIIQGLGVTLNLSEQMSTEVTKRLAEAYQRLPNEPRARAVYLDFIAKRPSSPRLPFYSDEIISSFLGEGMIDKADQQRDLFVAQLTRDQRWWTENREQRKSVFEAEDLLENYLISSAQINAEKGYKSNDQQSLKLAREQYVRFLTTYPFSPLVPQARYELAQVEYFSGLYQNSKENFEAILQDTRSTGYHDNAGYGYFLSVARQNNYPVDKDVNLEPKRGATGELLPPQKLSEREINVLNAAGRYLEKATPGDRKQRVYLKVAEIHFLNNGFDLSEKAAEQIIIQEGSGLTKARAIRLSAEIASLKGDWKKVSSRNSQLQALSLDEKVAADAGLTASDLSDRNFQGAENLEKSGQGLEAAEEYDRIAIAFPKSSSSPYATWKAAQLYRQEFRFKQSDIALERLKGTRYEAEASFLKASNARSYLDYGRAAQMFTDFVSRHPRHELAPKAAFLASAIRRDLKQSTTSAEMMLRYYSYNPSDDVLADAVEIASRGPDIALILKILPKFQSRTGQARWRARIYLAEAYWRKNEVKKAADACKEIYALSNQAKGTTAIIERSQRVCQLFEASLVVRQNPKDARALEMEKKFAGDSDLVARFHLEKAKALHKSGSKDEAIQIAKSALVALKGNVFKPEGKQIYDFLREVSMLPVGNAGLLFPWHLADGLQIGWALPANQQLAWGDIRSLCDREQYDACIASAKTLVQSEPSDELRYNLVLAHLRAGHHVDGYQVFKDYATASNWSPSSVRAAWILGFHRQLPLNSKIMLAQDSRQKAESLAADAERLFEERKLKEAIQRVTLALYEDATLAASYLAAARIFQETGNFELMRDVFRLGAQTSKSRSVLYGFSRILDSMTDGLSSSEISESTEQFDSRALYGQAYAAWAIGDKVSSEALMNLLQKKSTLAEDLQLLQKTLEGTSGALKVNEGSGRYLYLQAVQTNDQERLKKARELGVKQSFWLRDYEKQMERQVK